MFSDLPHLNLLGYWRKAKMAGRGIEGDMQTVWKIAAAHDDHEEAMQMMPGFGHGFLDGADVGRGWRGHCLGMRMPVADKMQSLPMHLVDLPLFLASVGKVQVSRPTVCQSWTGSVGDRYLMIRESSEELAPGLH
jgi:hypothetical protein